jgi:hypothetical protein
VGPEELRRFPELDRGIIRLTRKSSVYEFEPCLFAFVGALLGRCVKWVVAKVKGGVKEVEMAGEEGPTPVERVNLVLGAVHRAMGSTRLLDAGGAPVGGNCALDPEAFEQVIDELQPEAYMGVDSYVVPPFGHLWHLHAALNREVEDMLAFVAAATRDVTDAYRSWAPSAGSEWLMCGLFSRSPWRRATCGTIGHEDLDVAFDTLQECLGAAIRRAGIKEWLVEDVLDYVRRLVVAYTKAMLIVWEVTEDAESDEDSEESDEDSEYGEDEETEEDEEEEEEATGHCCLECGRKVLSMSPLSEFVCAEDVPEGSALEEGLDKLPEPMSDDEDYCLNDKGIQVSASDIDETASHKNAVDDGDLVVTPVIRADEVLEVLRVHDRLGSGILSCTVLGELESFLRVPGGYREVLALIHDPWAGPCSPIACVPQLLISA